MFHRILGEVILDELRTRSKVVVLHGPRRVGKTTLLRWARDQLGDRVLTLNGDFLDDQRLLRPERAALERLVRGIHYLFVDEAQAIEDVGTSLKLIHDEHPVVRVLATGSSAFELTERTGEPLTGRRFRHVLYPISYAEQRPTLPEAAGVIEHALVYGAYPECLLLDGHTAKVDYLRQLAGDYLLKDIFRQVDVNRARLLSILRLLALQLGSEVSLSELGRQVHADVKTVARYLHFLEEVFVIFQLGGFSRNLRKEVAKSRKIYFLDLGVRNAILGAFQPLEARDDVGALFENLMIVERRKQLEYAGRHVNTYFWRTYDRQEIDLIEEEEGALRAFEFKWNPTRRPRFPKAWRDHYPEAENRVITREVVHDWLSADPD